MISLASDPSLVAAVRAGDRTAFDAIYSRHGQPLVGFIRERVGCQGLAEDILHDLFVSIWSRFDTWDVRGDLRTYLFSAARNHVWSHYAKQKVRRHHAQEEKATAARSVEPTVVEELAGERLRQAVARWIDEMPDRRREVFELSRYEHLTYQQIADRLGISIKTVETQMSRALSHLRSRLADFEAERV